jgi:carboxypeptidase Taq
LDKHFKPLKEGLLSITEQIYRKKKSSTSILNQAISPELQLHFCRSLLKILGLDETVARLDTSSHPFCNSICPSDVRLTTHIKPNGIFNSISSTMHECGHALYEAGLPEEEFGLPLGEACSLGVHESQSRLFETFIGQGKHFIHLLKDKLSAIAPQLNADDLYEAINVVEPSFIRIESDEVTYCLHILLRYELEKQLIEGKLKAKDLPKAWNDGMKRYLGITAPNDQKGCLQDIHWSMGLFGYFPTYALGNLYAAQIFERLQISIKDLNDQIAQGHFAQITSWLHNHIYRFGREKSPEELIKNATHKSLSCEAYLNYLNQKYLKT